MGLKIRMGPHEWCAMAEEYGCREFAVRLLVQLISPKYRKGASILKLQSEEEYLGEHRTARKRMRRAYARGYSFGPIKRENHVMSIRDINVSLPERQGRPMSPSYTGFPQFSPLPDYPCPRHRIETYGVFAPNRGLVAYNCLYTCGDLLLVSQLLGHGEYLEDEIMYLLMVESLCGAVERAGPLTCFYNMHDSGTEGLRFFKERLGFRPEDVEWVL